MDDEFIAGLRATRTEDLEEADPDRRTRRLRCLRIYQSEHTAPVAEPPEPPRQDWAHWRRALAEAASINRNTLRSTAVDACLAVTEQAGTTDPTATLLARHLMTIHRWWPGADQARHTDRSSEMIARAVVDINNGANRERWMVDGRTDHQ
ncbi:hypothetical protein [Saccharothrix stipae]